MRPATPTTRAFQSELRRAIEGEIRFDDATRALYSTDASNYRLVPLGVVIPRHQGDVATALKLSAENEVAVLPRGGGTSLAGQACNTALVIDFSKYMNTIVSVDPDRRLAVVEPGVVQAQLNAALSSYGLFFAPDPSTKDRCCIGGMIGNNSCGAHSVAYGKTADNLAALEVMLLEGTQIELGPMGEADVSTKIAAGGVEGRLYSNLIELRDRYSHLIRTRYPDIPRRVSGYNLDQLLPEKGLHVGRAVVGSEGTLAVTLRATLELKARPKRLAMVVLGFDDIFCAADQAPWILEHRPQALEAFDYRLLDFAKRKGLHLGTADLLPPGRGFLIVEFGGEREDAVREAAERVRAEAQRSSGSAAARLFIDQPSQSAVWKLRESGLAASALIPGYPRTWPGAEDVAVPPAKLGAYLRRFRDLLERHQLEAAAYYGHFGDGCVHCRINFDLASAAGIARFRAAMEELATLVVEFGGSLSGEHGDGLARSELLPRMFGGELQEAFRLFKHAFDPAGVMNPGVIVDAKPLDSNLRLGRDFRPAQPRTYFDFGDDGGFAGAALRCVGVGSCRKTSSGTMCPSYMATREEMHSTRGRARLLFEAMTGTLLKGGMAEPAVRDAMDLCLACKGCKRECPAAVDMATYKAEFLAHYYRAHWRPLSAQVFGGIHELARLGSAFPAIANFTLAAPVVGSALKQILHVHPERDFPQLAARSFRSWFNARIGGREQGREVLLFPDTFTNFFEPEVAVAAVRVLEHAGFRVVIPPTDLCCGRPLYDQGMLGLAKRRLSAIVDCVAPFIERGVTMVGLEPSCILTFRDEALGLLGDDPRAQQLSGRALLFDEFLAREGAKISADSVGGHALLHGHCHHKAIAGLDSELSVLSQLRNLSIEALDSGCCGMAGAFGYERSHFEVSRQIGERVLLPAVRASDPGTLIIADGFSCRAQIRQFCPGRRALHLAQVLSSAL